MKLFLSIQSQWGPKQYGHSLTLIIWTKTHIFKKQKKQTYFVFNRRKKIIQICNDMKMSKWSSAGQLFLKNMH